jgi:hypothetical protein
MIIYAEIKDGICARKFWAEAADVAGRVNVVPADPWMVEGEAVADSKAAYDAKLATPPKPPLEERVAAIEKKLGIA